MKILSPVYYIALPHLNKDNISRNYLLERFIGLGPVFKEKAQKYPLKKYLGQASNIEILFLSSFYSEIILELVNKGYKVGVIGNEQDLEWCETYNIPYVPYFPILNELYKIYFLPFKDQQKAISTLKTFFQNLFKNLKGLVLYNDISPLERFLILTFKNKWKAIIQHGLIFEDNFNNYSKFSLMYVDFYLTWGKYFSNAMKNTWFKNFNKEIRIKLLSFGYPKAIKPLKKQLKISELNQLKIGILGQPWELVNTNLAEKKWQIFQKTAYLLNKAGFQIFYKPHPQEWKLKELKPVGILFKGTLEDFFKKMDVVISLTSTALLEASLSAVPAIQIHSKDFIKANFEELGISYSIKEEHLENLPNLVRRIVNQPFKVNPNTVRIINPGKEFIKFLITRNLI